MAQKYLPYVSPPCLIVATKGDELSLKASSNMIEYLPQARLQVIDDKDHSFKDESVREEVLPLCSRWFRRYFNRQTYEEQSSHYTESEPQLPFYDRSEAAHYLARALQQYKNEDPLVLAIPRAG